MIFNTIDGILFLSYFTDYNIGEIYRAFAYNGLDEYLNNEGERLSRELNIERSLEHKIKDSLKEAKIAYERNRYNKIFHLPISSEKYPALLKSINQPPPMLYLKGRFINNKNVAIIGTRDVSKIAEERTNNIVRKFTNYNYGIVSGLALGIDSFAHKEALNQKAYTIAVLAHSLDTVYPKENYWLANKILDADGALISEIPTGLNRGKKSFVERNRIQSGLSEFVVPVEMAKSSGTMHTVNFSKTQKRKLLLIKPRPEYENQPQYEGINHLIEIQKKNNSETVYVLEDNFELSDVPSENKYRTLELFDYMNIEIDKFRLFLIEQGFSKTEDGNREIWRSKDSREFSFISNINHFSFNQSTDNTILYNLGLQQAFRNYFGIAH